MNSYVALNSSQLPACTRENARAIWLQFPTRGQSRPLLRPRCHPIYIHTSIEVPRPRGFEFRESVSPAATICCCVCLVVECLASAYGLIVMIMSRSLVFSAPLLRRHMRVLRCTPRHSPHESPRLPSFPVSTSTRSPSYPCPLRGARTRSVTRHRRTTNAETTT